MPHHSQPDSQSTTLTSLLPGTSSGIVKHLLGFPLGNSLPLPYHLGKELALTSSILSDTLKVLLQSNHSNTYSSRFPAFQALRQTVSQHGITGLYRGGSLPCLAWTATDGLLYGILWQGRKTLFGNGWGWWTEPGVRPGEERRLKLQGHFLAGSIAGLSVSPFSHPIDVCKSKGTFDLVLSAPPFLSKSSFHFGPS